MADSGILFPLILGVTMQQVHKINEIPPPYSIFEQESVKIK